MSCKTLASACLLCAYMFAVPTLFFPEPAPVWPFAVAIVFMLACLVFCFLSYPEGFTPDSMNKQHAPNQPKATDVPFTLK